MNIEGLKAAFAENFETRGEVGASVSIWDGDGEVISLHQGTADRAGERPWSDQTIIPVWSATKGPATAVVLKLLAEANLDLKTPVAEVWPALGVQPSIGQLLSHQAGLAALHDRVSIMDRVKVVQALEKQTANWELGDGHGYHPRTFGFLLEALVDRLDAKNRTLGEVWNDEFAQPLDLDFWIGLPEGQHDRVAQLRTARVGKGTPGNMPSQPDQSGFFRAFGDPDSLTRAAFVSPAGFNAVTDLNKPEAWQVGWAGMGGVGSASALAKFYAMLANRGTWQGHRIVPDIVCDWAEQQQVKGPDKILLVDTAFSAGFMSSPSLSAGPQFPRAFGHPGAGGSHAFADPVSGIGFAYVMNQMEQSVLPNLKSIALIDGFFGK